MAPPRPTNCLAFGKLAKPGRRVNAGRRRRSPYLAGLTCNQKVAYSPLTVSDVFAAVADPTRRRLLEVLRRHGPLSLTELAEPLPMSRQAVTKHLDVLCRSGLVRTRRVGRERRHEIDARPLRELDDWLRSYEEFWDDRLARLEHHLNREEARDDD